MITMLYGVWVCLALMVWRGSAITQTESQRFLVNSLLYLSCGLIQHHYGLAGMSLVGAAFCLYWLYQARHQKNDSPWSRFAHEHVFIFLGILAISTWILPYLKEHQTLPAWTPWAHRCLALYSFLRLLEGLVHRVFGMSLAHRDRFIRGWYYALAAWLLAVYGVESLLLAAFVLSWVGVLYRRLSGHRTPGTRLAQENVAMVTVFWLIRSFFFQPFLVPTGSLEPTIAPGDFVLVKQYAYGLRFPVWGWKLWSVAEPRRGDIAVFRYPPQPDILYVKRVIGVPGDRIHYSHDTLTINGIKIAKDCTDTERTLDQPHDVVRCREYLPGAVHDIFISDEDPHRFKSWEWTIPEGQYLMLGDNRQGSHDSRFWGYVDERMLVGKVEWVLLSFDKSALPQIRLRPERLLSSVYASD